jgi:dsDNA-binding SOS-regulon protein
MQKLSANRVSKSLNANQKLQKCQSAEQHLNFFGAIHIISCRARLVTIDETWLYHYDPETNQQSLEWWHSVSPHHKKFRVQKTADILGSKRHKTIDYLQKGQREDYSFLLMQLKDILKEKLHGQKVTNGVSFLHDSAPAHRTHATQKKLA